MQCLYYNPHICSYTCWSLSPFLPYFLILTHAHTFLVSVAFLVSFDSGKLPLSSRPLNLVFFFFLPWISLSISSLWAPLLFSKALKHHLEDRFFSVSRECIYSGHSAMFLSGFPILLHDKLIHGIFLEVQNSKFHLRPANSLPSKAVLWIYT